MEDFFAEWEIEEIDTNIAIYNTHLDELTLGEKTIDVEFLTGDTLLCVIENNLYCFGVSYNTSGAYKNLGRIFCVNLENKEIEYLHLGQYCPNNDDNAYTPDAYYQDGNIIIFDNATTTIYNIETGKAKKLPAEAFSQVYTPKYTFEYPQNTEGSRKDLKIIGEEGERILTLEYMAEKHEYIKRVIDFGVHNNIDGPSDPVRNFFSEGFVVKDEIYLLCNVYDRNGHSNGIVFRYNYDKDEFVYLYHSFNYGLLFGDIIPVFS